MIGDRIEVNIDGGLNIAMPRMVHVRQKFVLSKLDSVSGAVVEQFKRPEVRAKIRPGMSIAVGVGSRGVNNIAECTKAVVAELKALGAKPFIFPAMGSHGGATAEGQREVLDGYGINESLIGCPVHSQMDVVEIGKLAGGMPIYMDKLAAAADGVVVIPRIKPHTNYRAPIESGIVKMLAVGMAKIVGATELHTQGMDTFGELLPRAVELIMAKKNILFGVAMVENAADETAIVEIVTGERIFDREPVLQAIAKEFMPRLQFDEIDVLVVEKLGKNISGAGMDPNVTGRNCRFVEWKMKPEVKKIAVLSLTAETDGNATGVGAADVITMQVFKDIDVAKTYANCITSTTLDAASIPMIMNTDEDAIRLAVKTVVRVKPEECKIVHIADTLHVVDIHVSEPMLPYILQHPDKFEIVGAPEPMKFDANGTLYRMPGKPHQAAHAGTMQDVL